MHRLQGGRLGFKECQRGANRFNASFKPVSNPQVSPLNASAAPLKGLQMGVGMASGRTQTSADVDLWNWVFRHGSRPPERTAC